MKLEVVWMVLFPRSIVSDVLFALGIHRVPYEISLTYRPAVYTRRKSRVIYCVELFKKKIKGIRINVTNFNDTCEPHLESIILRDSELVYLYMKFHVLRCCE